MLLIMIDKDSGISRRSTDLQKMSFGSIGWHVVEDVSYAKIIWSFLRSNEAKN